MKWKCSDWQPWFKQVRNEFLPVLSILLDPTEIFGTGSRNGIEQLWFTWKSVQCKLYVLYLRLWIKLSLIVYIFYPISINFVKGNSHTNAVTDYKSYWKSIVTLHSVTSIKLIVRFRWNSVKEIWIYSFSEFVSFLIIDAILSIQA